jgi:hypothetical protein
MDADSTLTSFMSEDSPTKGLSRPAPGGEVPAASSQAAPAPTGYVPSFVREAAAAPRVAGGLATINVGQPSAAALQQQAPGAEEEGRGAAARRAGQQQGASTSGGGSFDPGTPTVAATTPAAGSGKGVLDPMGILSSVRWVQAGSARKGGGQRAAPGRL